MYLIERTGRRMLLIVSVIGVGITLALMGGAFILINKDSVPAFSPLSNVTAESAEAGHCFDFELVAPPKKPSSFSNCDSCTTNEHCGFCQTDVGGGYCLPAQDGFQLGPGPCANVTNPDIPPKVEFLSGFCHSKYTAIPIVLMVVYLSFFSVGMFFRAVGHL